MASIRRERYRSKKIFLHLLHHVHQYSQKNNSDTKLKIITFIEFFIHHVSKVKVFDVIKDSKKSDLFKIYTQMINDESLSSEINPLISNLSFLENDYKKNILQKMTYADRLAVETNKILAFYKKTLDQNLLQILFSDLIALIYINYQTQKFEFKASKNLENEIIYEQKVECVISTLEFIDRIRLTLIKLIPTNMNLLIVLLNTLLEKMY